MNVALAEDNNGRGAGRHIRRCARPAAGRRHGGGNAPAGVRRFRAYRSADPAHRRMEIYRPAQPAARRGAAWRRRRIRPRWPRPPDSSETLGTGDTQKLVIVDGVFAAGLSDLTSGGGVTVHALSAMLDDATSATRADLLRSRIVDPMIALNAAFATDGMLIDIADDAVPARPLHIVHVATRPSVAAFTRSLVRIGNRARVTLVESFVATESAKAYQAHDAVVIWIGDDSDLQHAARDGRRRRCRRISQRPSSQSVRAPSSTPSA